MVIPEVGVRLRHFSILENIKIDKLSRIDLNIIHLMFLLALHL